MFLAQLSDLHILEPGTKEEHYLDNNRRLEVAVTSLNAESPRPSAVVITGDLTSWGSAVEYEQLTSRLAPLEIQALPIGGNHDDRDRMRAAFPDMPWIDADHASWSVVAGGVRIIGLDSTIPGQAGACIDDERAAWLAAELNNSAEPTVLAIHHPPFLSGIDWMDEAGFEGLDLFTEVLRDSVSPGFIMCGHLHRPIHSVVAGTRASVGISTVQHVALDLKPNAPVRLILDPVGYHIHSHNGGEWLTHTRYIDTGEEPFVPDWA